jgi:CDP-paratose 2-epimerase
MKWVVTGAAGFIGCNVVAALRAAGDVVVGVDDLSRPGTELNLAWLEGLAGGGWSFERCDVRDSAALEHVFSAHGDACVVLHLAAQVAVTTSIREPRRDFEINALGTLNVCEAVRRYAPGALLINASTNKVYGSREGGVELVEGRWWDASAPAGVEESAPLEFHSPYACSKGAGEQYVLDYSRTFGLRSVSLRQSCIYGQRQFGIEDQGWMAWLTAAAIAGVPFTIYGDGRQVRDALFVDDLVALYRACAEASDRVDGLAINVGGGPANALSINELVARLEARLGRTLEYRWAESRPGDQRFFVADTTRAARLLGWQPTVSLTTGLDRLHDWLELHIDEVLAAVGAADQVATR